VLTLLCHCLPVFYEMDFTFFVGVTLIKIANTSLDRSAALVPQLTERGSAALHDIRQIQVEICGTFGAFHLQPENITQDVAALRCVAVWV